jgi:hypothetical protein
MRLRMVGPCALVAVVALLVGIGGRASAAEKEDFGKLLQALPRSKQTLADGIKQAAAKRPEVAISAKFELEEGKLSLSVYTAEKGLNADAEHNVLKELAGSPTGAAWKPETEVFKDVPHVSRASEQLTLLSMSKVSLLDVLTRAQKDHPGTVFSITPVLHEGKAQFVVLVAADGKVTELKYDLTTGEPTR